MFIVCVTSCPVGIAHTFMAAEGLQKAIEAQGHEAKVETQGAQGQQNQITEEDIRRADACIIACDVKIKDPGGFEELPTLECSVYEAVNEAESVVKELLEAIG